MQLLQRLIGADEDSDKLLASAKSKARYRVVVKRPIHAKFLSDQEPSYSLKVNLQDTTYIQIKKFLTDFLYLNLN